MSAVRVQVSADIIDGSSSDSDSDENVSLEAELKLLKQQVSGGVSLSPFPQSISCIPRCMLVLPMPVICL